MVLTQNPKQVVTELKASKYNVSIPEGPHSYLLVNTLTTAVLRIRESSLTPAHSALLDTEAPFNLSLDEATLNLLLSNGFLVPIDFDETKWLENLHWKARVGRDALGVGIAVTLGCNFRCTYCYQWHQNTHLSLQLEDSIADFVANNLRGKSLLKVMWFGGEPLLRLKTIRRISRRLLNLTRAQNIDYDGAITTNGFLLTPATSNVLLEAGITDVQVTLDGPPSIHDKRRFLANGRPTFQTILSNLIKVAEMFSRVIIRINIDKRNQNGIPQLLELLSPLREHIVLAFRAATSPESPQVSESWCIPPNNYWNLHEDLATMAEEIGFRVLRGYAIPGTSFCSGYQHNSITVDPYGDVHRCPICIGRREQRYGILTRDGRIKVENGFQKQWDKWSPFLDDDCINCKALPICMGGCLWYLGKEKSTSLRCFAKHGLARGIARDTLLSGGIRATWHRKEVI
ncbi:MAG: radical SAM protein [Proteobacteria bacterium]|nr:radical SAM protein [Pseudomonadota bacterium]